MHEESVVYLVWELTHALPFGEQRLLGIFASEESAKTLVAELTAKNEDPMEEDSYGPYQGTEFMYYKNEVIP